MITRCKEAKMAGEETRGIAVEGLAEVVLNVRDMASSLAFYRDLLGLTVISPPERTNPIFLKAGDANSDLPALVVLVQLPADAEPFTRPRTLHHLALAIPAESFDQTMAALTKLGVSLRTGQHPV